VKLSELNHANIDRLKQKPNRCPYCGNPITYSTGRRMTPRGMACEDCYYEQLGNLVEQHPIVGVKP
jgi:hypothetical protein